MIVLDTDVLSLLDFPHSRQTATLVARLRAADEEVTVTIISFQEQMLGWLAYIKKRSKVIDQVPGYDRLLGALERYRQFRMLPFEFEPRMPSTFCAARIHGSARWT